MNDKHCIFYHVMEPTGTTVKFEGDARTYQVVRCKRCGLEKHHPVQEQKTCIACGQRVTVNPDGTPVGGALPCGH